MYGPAVSSPLSKSAPAAIDRKPGRASIVRPTINKYAADRRNRAAIAGMIVGRSRLTSSVLLASFPQVWPFALMVGAVDSRGDTSLPRDNGPPKCWAVLRRSRREAAAVHLTTR